MDVAGEVKHSDMKVGATTVNPVTIAGQLILRNFTPSSHIWLCRTELLHPSILQAIQLRGPEAVKADQIGVAVGNTFTAEQKEKHIRRAVLKDSFMLFDDAEVHDVLKQPSVDIDYDVSIDTTTLVVA
jgi:hypothetical protein